MSMLPVPQTAAVASNDAIWFWFALLFFLFSYEMCLVRLLG